MADRAGLFAGLDKTELLIGLGVFVSAVAVRMVYLCEIAGCPAFEYPIVDAASYDRLARLFVGGEGFESDFFWQPFFYPFFLSLVYAVSHSSIACAKVVQVFLGGATCFFVYRLGRRIFGRNVGIVAAALVTFYGPLIFYEGELLAGGWAALWSVVLILFFLEVASTGKLWLCTLLGICVALSILTRPTFIPFTFAGVIWLMIVFYHRKACYMVMITKLAVLVGGFLLIALPVAVLNLRVTGHFGFLPSSGGINFYVGNNPDRTETLTARPGWQWQRITDLPKRAGVFDQWEAQEFFKRRFLDYVFAEPLGFLRGLLDKIIQFSSPREIPRNTDIYLFRQWSWLLSLLVWKVGGFGFPFGIIMPLTLLGFVGRWRRLSVPLILFLILYPLSIVLVFVSGRYRIEVMPVMCVVAAVGLCDLLGAVQRRCWFGVTVSILAGVAMALLSSIAGPFTQERGDFESEFYYSVGFAEKERGRQDLALLHFSKALALRPNYAEAHNSLGALLQSQGDLEGAISHYRQALEAGSDFAWPYYSLGGVFKLQGKLGEAVNYYYQALELEPCSASVHNDLGNALSQQGKFDDAIDHYRRALELRPGWADAYFNMGLACQSQGKFDDAVSCYEQVLQVKSDNIEAWFNLGLVFQLQGKPGQAAGCYNRVLQMDPRHARSHNNLGSLLLAEGKSDAALGHFYEALRIKPDYVMSLNGAARILATCPDPRKYAASEAVILAERAARLTNCQDADVLETLSIAYAAAGQFEMAVAKAEAALALAVANKDGLLVDRIRRRLTLYQEGKPYLSDTGRPQ